MGVIVGSGSDSSSLLLPVVELSPLDDDDDDDDLPDADDDDLLEDEEESLLLALLLLFPCSFLFVGITDDSLRGDVADFSSRAPCCPLSNALPLISGTATTAAEFDGDDC